jgi:DNA-directed RNA polymerase subunit RPC12/RpoP
MTLASRTRALLLVFVLWPLFGLAIVSLSLQVSAWFAVLLLPALFLFQKYFSTIRCEYCGKPLAWNELTLPRKLFGVRFSWWTPFVPRRCSSCGNEYDRLTADTRA